MYPDVQLTRRLPPVLVCVDVAIDATGVVTAASPRSDAVCTPDLDARDTDAFRIAAVHAVRGWTYPPALLCVAPVDFTGGDACLATGSVETPTAVRLSYAFRFSQRAGRPHVERASSP